VGALHGTIGLPPAWVNAYPGRTTADDPGRAFELIAQAQVTDIDAARSYLDARNVTSISVAETTTLGIRRLRYDRTVLPRESRTVETPYGPVRVKVSRCESVQFGDPE